MGHSRVTTDLTVAEVLEHWPQAIAVFFRYRMACVGCPIATFETLAEVAAIYGLDLEYLMHELKQTIRIEAHSYGV